MPAQTRAVSDRLARAWHPVGAVVWSVRRSLRLLLWLHLAVAVTVLAGWLADVSAVVAGAATLDAALLVWPRLHARSWRAVVERWHTKRWYRTRWEPSPTRSACRSTDGRRLGTGVRSPSFPDWSG